MAHDAPATIAELRDERLSAFMDGELPDGERAAVEIEIADDPAMRADLEGLRQVRDGLRDLEIVPAPRSFALTAPPARPATWLGMPRLDLAMRTGAAVAAFAFAVVLVGDIGGTGGSADRDASAALIAAPASFSTESTAGGAAEPQATLTTAQAATDGETGSPAATPEPTVSEGTAERLATGDDSGERAGAETTTAQAPTEQSSPPDTEEEAATSDGVATLAAPNTGSSDPAVGGAGGGSTDPSTDPSIERATAPPPPATGVEPAATSGDDGTTKVPVTEDATTGAATADEPAASPQPSLASPVLQPESDVPSASESAGGASAAAITLGALAVLFAATSLVLWRRRSVQR